ncbi:MAG: GDP-mannose 4,6-dehydratase [bacterium]|nr:GDP-mannose 4,6-dehydratase [bacterium]
MLPAKLPVKCYAIAYHHLYGDVHYVFTFLPSYMDSSTSEMVIHKFAENIAQGEPIPFFGDGSSRRDYTYIDDIIQGILASIEKNYPYEVFNLGNSNTISLKELVATIEQAIGKQAIIKQMDNQPGDVPITYADISYSEKMLGFSPSTNIYDGIKKFAAWFKAK